MDDTSKNILQSLSLQDIIQELRRRQLLEKLDGVLEVKPDNTVSFGIVKLIWPPGAYNVKIEYISQITTEEQPPKTEG